MKDQILLRPAHMSERTMLEQLQWRASLQWEEDREFLLANPDAIELPDAQIEEGHVVVAAAAGALVGFAVVLPGAEGDAELDGLFVEPQRWMSGIGRALIAHVARMARDRGCVWLWVTANDRALGFYRRCGFEELGMVPTRFRPGIRMRLWISAGAPQ